MREEVEEHLALQTAENVRAGLSPDEARRQAVLKFGAVEAIKEHYRDEQRLPFLDSLVQDVRYALRQLRRAPLFTLTATLSLAVGIGANAAIFTLVDRVLLRPLPVSDPQELVFVTDQRSLRNRARGSRIRSTPPSATPTVVERRGGPVRPVAERGHRRTGRPSQRRADLRQLLQRPRRRTQFGRPLTPEDDRTPGAHPVAVISDGFWRRSFGSDPAVLGRAVRINDHTFTIVGVAARGFTGTDVGQPTDIWLPMMMQREVGRDLLTDARTNWLEMIGRLKPGVSLERAGAELTAYLERRAQPAGASGEPAVVLQPGDKGSSPCPARSSARR